MNGIGVTNVDLRGLFAAIDRQDTTGFVAYLADDAVLRFGSSPPVIGTEDIRAAVDGFFAAIAKLEHQVRYATEADGRVICEGTVTYERHDGSTITLPFANVMELADDEGSPRFRHYKVYADYSPLWSGAG